MLNLLDLGCEAIGRLCGPSAVRSVAQHARYQPKLCLPAKVARCFHDYYVEETSTKGKALYLGVEAVGVRAYGGQGTRTQGRQVRRFLKNCSSR